MDLTLRSKEQPSDTDSGSGGKAAQGDFSLSECMPDEDSAGK